MYRETLSRGKGGRGRTTKLLLFAFFDGEGKVEIESCYITIGPSTIYVAKAVFELSAILLVSQVLGSQALGIILDPNSY